jgi:hypothetical protein
VRVRVVVCVRVLTYAVHTYQTSSNRDSLFNNGAATELHVTSMDHRERLIKVVEKNEENKDRLIASRQTLEHVTRLPSSCECACVCECVCVRA